MIRTSYRYLLAGLIAVALVAGFTSSAGASTAPARGAAGATTSLAKAVDCSVQQSNVTKAGSTYKKKTKKLAKAKRQLHRAQKQLKRAKAGAKSTWAKKVKTAKKHKRKFAKQKRAAKKKLVLRQQQLAACQSLNGGGSGGGGGGGTTSAASPIQSLCDLGLPQAVCDLAALPGDQLTASGLCAAQGGPLPQVICDLANGTILSLPGLPGVPAVPGLPVPPIGSFPGIPGLPALPPGGDPVGLLCGVLTPILGSTITDPLCP